jgi:hypothetical protein
MVLDQDTTGRLWTSWEGDNEIWVAWSTSADHRLWSEPISLRSGVDSDDISSVVAFGTNVGVFWSDQDRDEFAFRVHRDSDPPHLWQDVEVAAAGDGHADDHVCIKASASGALFAVTKDDYDQMFLHRRDVDGSWDTEDGVISGTGTRPSLMICDEEEKLYVAYTSWSSSSDKIKLRRASYSSMNFSTYVSSLIAGGTFNNATGTKQVLPQGCYMGMAGGEGDVWWNGWGELPPDGPPPPEAPVIIHAVLQERPSETPQHAELALNMPLDEGQGLTTRDTSGHGHEGALEAIVGKAGSAPVWTSGQSGTALHFDGESWVRVESSPFLAIAGSFTVEAWVRRYPDVSGDGTILSKGPSQHRNYHLMLLENGRVEFKWEVDGGDNRGVVSARSLTPGAWQHVTCIYDAENHASRIYIDGQLDASATDSGIPVTNDEPMHLGRRISGTTAKDPLTADLDGIRIWRGVAYSNDFDPGPMPTFPSTPAPRHQVNLSWERPADEEGDIVYSVTMSTNNSGLFPLANGLTGTTWTHRSPVYGTLRYEIRATRVEDGLISKPATIFVTYSAPQPESKEPEAQLSSKGMLSMVSSLQAAPNPFNPQTTILLQLPRSGQVDLAVYDVRGRRVRHLHHGHLTAGGHEFPWDARTDSGRSLASGVYFLRGDVMGEIFRQRLVLLK